MTKCDECGADAEWVLGSVRACDLHRALTDEVVTRNDLPIPRWRKIDGGTVAVAVVIFAFFLAPGCGSDRAGPDVDPILYVLGGWFVAVVVVALASDRIVRWVQRRADVQTRDESEMESGS